MNKTYASKGIKISSVGSNRCIYGTVDVLNAHKMYEESGGEGGEGRGEGEGKAGDWGERAR